jgi:CTP synthase (UTP-ammonia lyase)
MDFQRAEVSSLEGTDELVVSTETSELASAVVVEVANHIDVYSAVAESLAVAAISEDEQTSTDVKKAEVTQPKAKTAQTSGMPTCS